MCPITEESFETIIFCDKCRKEIVRIQKNESVDIIRKKKILSGELVISGKFEWCKECNYKYDIVYRMMTDLKNFDIPFDAWREIWTIGLGEFLIFKDERNLITKIKNFSSIVEKIINEKREKGGDPK